jgi:biopolymer transport protein ExbB
LDPTGHLALDDVRNESSAREWFVAGGSVMYPIAGVALASIVLVIERLLFLFGRNPNANKVAGRIIDLARGQRFAEAEQSADERPVVVTRVLAACLHRRGGGQKAMEDAIQEQLLQELSKLRRFMGGLATLAAVAPLLGLLGTVTGIIQTFDVIRSFGNANANLMAGGISEALITTEAGLMIAIPVVVVHSLLRGRSNRILADAERHSATLLTTLVWADRAARPAEAAPDPARRTHANGKHPSRTAVALEAAEPIQEA